ncbi:MAG: UDP-N-acetylmuramoyl-tripeptide--D-alanyl-D-alanine ligase [Actinobacteria bacterium]|nr:UDP-N-acetylmuramoyl-tripeptide--D-alanyl-D-alanine ligase [Actinomycetota bacterium]
MPTRNVLEVIKHTRGKLVLGSLNSRYDRIETDTRKTVRGALFWAIKGQHFDGNDFVMDAALKDFNGAVVSRISDSDINQIYSLKKDDFFVVEVDDTLKALVDLAKSHRKRIKAKVIAITGSSGKTTTKEMTASILKRVGKVVYAYRSFNNEIGLPLTLLRATSVDDFVILEMGTRNKGNIIQLCDVAYPDIGAITVIGPTHLEFLGSEEGVADAKAELLDCLREDGVACLFDGDMWFEHMRSKVRCRLIRYGFSEKCDVHGTDVKVGHDMMPSFNLGIGGREEQIKLNIAGKHNVINALAASSIAWALDVSVEDIKAGLQECPVPDMRSNLIWLKNDVCLIDDSYNANPISSACGINMLVDVGGKRRKIAVLGDMLELGEESDRYHYELGSIAARSGVDLIFSYGDYARDICQGVTDLDGSGCECRSFKDMDSLILELKKTIKPGDFILVKASRAMSFENISKAILRWDQD